MQVDITILYEEQIGRMSLNKLTGVEGWTHTNEQRDLNKANLALIRSPSLTCAQSGESLHPLSVSLV